VITHVVAPDDEAVIIAELERVAAMVDAVITTGGLGPTHDDRTVAAVAAFAGVPVVEDARWLQHLSDWMEDLGRQLTPRNARQALVPAGAGLFYESIGTAPAFQLTVPRSDRSVVLCVLPGVPTEMQHVMRVGVEPLIHQQVAVEGSEATSYRTLRTSGIAESTLADLVGEPLMFLGTSTLAFLPSVNGVRLRFGARHRDAAMREAELDRIEGILRERAGRYVVGSGDVPLSALVGKALMERGHTVAVAESCTGGLVGGAFTDVPGSSAWFEGGMITYSNAAKVQHLGVLSNTLDAVGAVSREVAEQMATGVRERFGTTWGIGVTGIAGPDGGTPEKPVGTVWIGVANPDSVEARVFRFGKDRASNRERSVAAALTMLWGKL
jgi:nicotinamide-nucleotide amidase